VTKPTDIIVITSGFSGSQKCVSKSSCFQPYSEVIAPGHTISWINEDSSPHIVTSGIPSDHPTGTIFYSNLIKSGRSFSHTFTQEGMYSYFCTVHPWLTGQITVGKQGV
jgi:plastocyanin